MQDFVQDSTVASGSPPANQPPQSDNLVGTVVDGKYQVLAVVGTGGMSSVYKARQLLLNKVCALKILHSRLLTDSSALVRFSQEAKSASTLSHPNIIQVFDIGVADGRPYQAIEYLEGRALSAEIRQSGGLPVQRALHVLIQACAALDHAHKNNVIHRDLKPSNIMLVNKEDDPDYVCLVDFGIAKVLPHEGEHVQQLTQTGEILGSPLYMSPEQCLGRKLDARSDIYSMGCLIYETLAGKPPLAGDTIFETIQKHQDQMPSSLKSVMKEPKYVEQFDQIIFKAMAKDPAQRYQSMFELGKDLLAIEAGDTSSITHKLRRQWQVAQIKLDTQRRRYPVKVLLSMGLSVLFLLALVIYLSQTLASTKVPAFVASQWPRFMPSQNERRQNSFMTDALVGHSSDIIVELALRQLKRDYDDPQKRIDRAAQMGASYLATGEFATAAMFFDRLRAEWSQHHVRPSSIDNLTQNEVLFANMADAYYYTNQFQLAAQFYHQAQRQYGDQAIHAFKRLALKAGDAELEQKQYYDAIGDFKDAAALPQSGPFPESSFDRPAGARPEIDAALYMSKVGDATRMAGDLVSAERAYKAAVREWLRCKFDIERSDQYISTCYFWLGCVQQQERKYVEAKQSFEQAIAALNARDARNGHNIAAIWDHIAQVDDQAGDWFGALNARAKSKLVARQS